jgi:hypothetical protein
MEAAGSEIRAYSLFRTHARKQLAYEHYYSCISLSITYTVRFKFLVANPEKQASSQASPLAESPVDAGCNTPRSSALRCVNGCLESMVYFYKHFRLTCASDRI